MELTRSHILPLVAIFLAVISGAIAISVYGQYSQVTANQSNVGNIFDTLDTVNGDISAIKASIDKLKTDLETESAARTTAVESLKTRDNSLDAKINERMMPTQTQQPDGLSNFRLEISSNAIEVGDAFKVTGFDKANTPFVASMVGSDRDDVMPLNGQTRSNGEFSLDLFIPSNWQPGVYTVTIIIGEKFDKINFSVAP